MSPKLATRSIAVNLGIWREREVITCAYQRYFVFRNLNWHVVKGKINPVNLVSD